MRKQMIENAAFDVATQVRAVEDTIENALSEIAELQSRIVRARSITGVGVNASHEAYEKLAAATQALVGARGSIGGCHAALVETQKVIPGLRTVGFGDVVPCPEKPSGSLRIVA